MKRTRTALVTHCMVSLCLCGSLEADSNSEALIDFARTQAAHIAARADVIAQVEEQNRISETLSDKQIALMDLRWQQQYGRAHAPLIHRLMNNPLSDSMRSLQLRSSELITEIIIMDKRGLNVAQSSVTSDIWQGDEAKWKKTFPLGPGAEHISEMGRDDSTGSIQIQISRTITNSQGHPIGAVTVGVAPLQF